MGKDARIISITTSTHLTISGIHYAIADDYPCC